MPTDPPRIVAAAVRRDGVTFTGDRHGRIIKQMVVVGFLRDMTRPVTFEEQGFVDSHGTYWNRDDAREIAIKAGQIQKDHRTLYNEDLW